MRVAVVGSGISGLAVAELLHGAGHEISVFEADSRIGGHTHTHTVELSGRAHAVDTGFIVYNEKTYPNFSRLLARLAVATRESSMSFSVSSETTGIEWAGTSLDTLYAQRRNLLRPAFHRMVADIVRFNRTAVRLSSELPERATLGELLVRFRPGSLFADHYIVPMGAAVWSTPPGKLLDFPARTFVRFFENHGMLSMGERPVWRTIVGGSSRYVEALVRPFADRIRKGSAVTSVRRVASGVELRTNGSAPESFDRVVMAVHSDDALRLLANPTPAEIGVLGAIPYQSNEVVLHTDSSLLPAEKKLWSSWNVRVPRTAGSPVTMTYDMNILQGIDSDETFCVTLNDSARIDPGKILRKLDYRHPLFTPAAIEAQRRRPEVSGRAGLHYCGAWWRHGFHEDGVRSALEVAREFGIDAPILEEKVGS